MNVILGADFGNFVRHAGAAGDAIDDAFGAFENAVQNAFRRRHFP